MTIESIDFPFWLRFAHFINLIFITLLIRSGIEILGALPKLYFNDDARPGSEWIKFTRKKYPKINCGHRLMKKNHYHLGLLYQDTKTSD